MLGCLTQMKNNDIAQVPKQSLEDVLRGEEPTEEFLEEFNALNESEEISDDELTKLALTSKADLIDTIDKPSEPNYKTNESSFLYIFIATTILSIAIYWVVKLLGS